MKLDRVIAVRNNKTVFRDGDRCVKVFGTGYSKADILSEALNQARAEECGLHIPKILEVTVVDGKWAICSEYIKGKTLDVLMDESPSKLKAYISLLAELQMHLHRKHLPCLADLHREMERLVGQAEFDESQKSAFRTRLSLVKKGDCVCHGDFDPSNIIIAEDGLPYILDWSHAAQGDSAADIARTYLLLQMNKGISCAELYLRLLCEGSGLQKADVECWLPLVAMASSVKSYGKERRFLLSQINFE